MTTGDILALSILAMLIGIVLMGFARAFADYKPTWMQRAYGPHVHPAFRVVSQVVYLAADLFSLIAGLLLFVNTLRAR